MNRKDECQAGPFMNVVMVWGVNTLLGGRMHLLNVQVHDVYAVLRMCRFEVSPINGRGGLMFFGHSHHNKAALFVSVIQVQSKKPPPAFLSVGLVTRHTTHKCQGRQ